MKKNRPTNIFCEQFKCTDLYFHNPIIHMSSWTHTVMEQNTVKGITKNPEYWKWNIAFQIVSLLWRLGWTKCCCWRWVSSRATAPASATYSVYYRSSSCTLTTVSSPLGCTLSTPCTLWDNSFAVFLVMLMTVCSVWSEIWFLLVGA